MEEVEVARRARHLWFGDFESHNPPDGRGSHLARICYETEVVVVVNRTAGVERLHDRCHFHCHSCHHCHCQVETWVPKCPW